MTAQSWFSIRAAASKPNAEVYVYGEIGPPDGLSAERFVKDLQALGPVKELTIRINSGGGDCFTATAAYNALARHSSRKTVWVDGVAASGGSLIAMAGDRINIPENALMMVHRPYAMVVGNAADMQAMVEALNRIEDSIVLAYRRSRQTDGRIKALLAAETWMNAREAVNLGFADQVIEPVRAAALADLSRFPYKHPRQPSVAATWDRVIAAKFPLTFRHSRGYF